MVLFVVGMLCGLMWWWWWQTRAAATATTAVGKEGMQTQPQSQPQLPPMSADPDDESTWGGRVPGEGDAAEPWSDDLKRRFRIYQSTMNENAYQYNMEILQQQARPWEAEVLLRSGKWPWQLAVRDTYVDKMVHHAILNYEPRAAADKAQRIYNQTAVLLLFRYNKLYGTGSGSDGYGGIYSFRGRPGSGTSTSTSAREMAS